MDVPLFGLIWFSLIWFSINKVWRIMTERKKCKGLSKEGWVDATKLTLDDWLAILFDHSPGQTFVDYCFPTDSHRQEYLTTIESRSEDEVRRLLRCFLIPSCSLGTDKYSLVSLYHWRKRGAKRYRDLMQMEHYRRLVEYTRNRASPPPWEGITWILDLLPHFTRDALEALNAYFLAHCQFLPDGRWNGLDDATEVIRAKFIGLPGSYDATIRFLLDLGSREFECLVERLYDAMGYKTRLTPVQKDRGRDVIACRQLTGKREHLLIECKLYEGPVGFGLCQRLLGAVTDEKANKGVMITTSRFTKGAKELEEGNPRLELISGQQLVPLMNEHLGARWPLRIEHLIREANLAAKGGRTSRH